MKKISLCLSVMMLVLWGLCGCSNSENVTSNDALEVQQVATENSVEETVEEEVVIDDSAEKEKEAQEAYEEGRNYLYGLNGKARNLEEAYKCFETASSLGNTDAYYYIGHLIDNEKYPEENEEKAIECYKSATDNNYASIMLGYIYYGKEGEDAAKEYFNNAVTKGCVEGNVGLAYLAEKRKDYSLAIELCNKVISEGSEPVFVNLSKRYLGKYYCNGLGVDQDVAKGIEMYEEAGMNGDSTSYCHLGKMYITGELVEQDGLKAIEYYQKAVDLGNATALSEIGYIYQMGIGVDADGLVAMEWYQKSVDAGYKKGNYLIGNLYLNGIGVEKDVSKTIEYWEKGAALGDTKAMGELAYLYRDGVGVDQDSNKAIDWYSKQTEAGDSNGYNMIGYMYYTGTGVPQDISKAVEWFDKAASLGNGQSAYNLGLLYLQGMGVEQDYAKAGEYLMLAYKNGISNAKEELMEYAYKIKYGDGILQQSSQGSFELFMALAEGGDSSGCYNVGEAYYSGTVVEQDYVKAAEWFHKADEAGSINARYYLGIMYRDGQGVDVDYSKAIEYLENVVNSNAGDLPEKAARELEKCKNQ